MRALTAEPRSAQAPVHDFLGRSVSLVIDHPYGSTHPVHGFIYHANYGRVADVNTSDEPIHAYYLGENIPLERVTGECIAIIHRDGNDRKLIVVPTGMDLSDRAISAAVAFQEICGPLTFIRPL